MAIGPRHLCATMRNRCKRFVKWGLATLRWDAVLLARMRRNGSCVVLNFHRVNPHPNPYWPAIHPNHFDQLLGFVVKQFDVVAISHLGSIQTRRTEKPPAVLSFDDGYLDFLQFASPILNKHHIRANLNIIPSCVESGMPPWNILLYDLLDSMHSSAVRSITLPGFTDTLKSDDFSEKARFGASIAGFLKNRPRQERLSIFNAFFSRFAESAFPVTAMMNRDQLKSIAIDHDIGAHSYHHESMGYETDSFFEADVQSCKTYFEDVLRTPCRYYAFPNGSYRREHIKLLRERGFERALLVDERYAKVSSFELPRFTISADSIRELKLQSVGYRAKIYANSNTD